MGEERARVGERRPGMPERDVADGGDRDDRRRRSLRNRVRERCRLRRCRAAAAKRECSHRDRAEGQHHEGAEGREPRSRRDP